MSFSIESTICDKNERRSYNEIADLFVTKLLNMKHVSAITKLKCKFYELLLFTVHNSEIYLSSENNEYYITNNQKTFKSLLPATSIFHCNICKVEGRILQKTDFECDNIFFYFLRNILKKKKSSDGKYYCDVDCPDLFDLIISKLEMLDFKYDEYIKMEQELEELKKEKDTWSEKKKKNEEKIKNTKDSLNKTCKIDCTLQENHEQIANEIQNLTRENIEIYDKITRYNQLISTIVDDNVRKVRNIKIFLDAVPKHQDLKQITPSAPELSLYHTQQLTQQFAQTGQQPNIVYE